MKLEAAATIPGRANRYQNGTEPSAKSTQVVPLVGMPQTSAACAGRAGPRSRRARASARRRRPRRHRRVRLEPSVHSAGVARHLRTILVLLLLAGTAAAFVVTEDLKLEPDPIARPRITPTFSPVCRCDTQTARIAFRLRQPDRLTLSIADSQGRVVRTLLQNARFGRGNHEFGWDGRDENGRVVPQGSYQASVELGKLNRTIDFPRLIRVDTTPARVEITRLRPRLISPDGDGRADSLTIRYKANEPVEALLLVNRRQEVRAKLRRNGALVWSPRGRKRGSYRLAVATIDQAGNRSRPAPGPDVRPRDLAIP